jgi:hypothetical protein
MRVTLYGIEGKGVRISIFDFHFYLRLGAAGRSYSNCNDVLPRFAFIVFDTLDTSYDTYRIPSVHLLCFVAMLTM